MLHYVASVPTAIVSLLILLTRNPAPAQKGATVLAHLVFERVFEVGNRANQASRRTRWQKDNEKGTAMTSTLFPQERFFASSWDR
jgi:hypothetical protein